MYDAIFSYEERGRLRLELRANGHTMLMFVGGSPKDWNDVCITWMRYGKCDVTSFQPNAAADTNAELAPGFHRHFR